MTTAPGVTVERAHLLLGNHQVLQDVSLRFDGGQWHSVLGRSGVGKSSLLRLLSGLETASTGRIEIDGNLDVSGHVAHLFQDDALLPWLSVYQNVALGLRLRGQYRPRLRRHVDALLERVGLSGWSNELPHRLSGGMRQRVALARTLLERRPVVLMDEPFGQLDAITRDELQTLAHDMLKDCTVILVTHDPLEALRLSDVIHVLQPGKPTRCQTMTPAGKPLRPLRTSSLLAQTEGLWQLLRAPVSS